MGRRKIKYNTVLKHTPINSWQCVEPGTATQYSEVAPQSNDKNYVFIVSCSPDAICSVVNGSNGVIVQIPPARR